MAADALADAAPLVLPEHNAAGFGLFAVAAVTLYGLLIAACAVVAARILQV